MHVSHELNRTSCVRVFGYLGACAAAWQNVRAQQSNFLALTTDFKDELGTFDAIVTKGSSLPHLHTDNDLRQALKVADDGEGRAEEQT